MQYTEIYYNSKEILDQITQFGFLSLVRKY